MFYLHSASTVPGEVWGERQSGKGGGKRSGDPFFCRGGHISSEMPFGESEERIMGTWGGGGVTQMPGSCQNRVLWVRGLVRRLVRPEWGRHRRARSQGLGHLLRRPWQATVRMQQTCMCQTATGLCFKQGDDSKPCRQTGGTKQTECAYDWV